MPMGSQGKIINVNSHESDPGQYLYDRNGNKVGSRASFSLSGSNTPSSQTTNLSQDCNGDVAAMLLKKRKAGLNENLPLEALNQYEEYDSQYVNCDRVEAVANKKLRDSQFPQILSTDRVLFILIFIMYSRF